jgi:hypothetical protein
VSGHELQTTGALIPHPVTGEAIDLTALGLGELAEHAGGLKDHRERLAEFDEALSARLLQELDRSAKWAVRAGDPSQGYQWEVQAPSPTAGTDEYPTDELRGALRLLINAGVIGERAAAGALERRLVLTLSAPFDADLEEIAEHARHGVRFQIAGVELEVVKAEPSERVVKAGINALRKIPDAVEALDTAKVERPVGRRRVKVTKITKECA